MMAYTEFKNHDPLHLCNGLWFPKLFQNKSLFELHNYCVAGEGTYSHFRDEQILSHKNILAQTCVRGRKQLLVISDHPQFSNPCYPRDGSQA